MEPVSGFIALFGHWLWAHLGHSLVVLLHKTLVILKVKPLLMSCALSVLIAIALWKIDIDPELRHSIYTIHHFTSGIAHLTILTAGIWSMGRVFTRGVRGFLPFFSVCIGLLLSALPQFPSPWTYWVVVMGFWVVFFYTNKRKVLWLFQGRKPRAY